MNGIAISADRCHVEAESVSPVIVGIEENPDIVVLAELVRVAPHLVRDPPRLPLGVVDPRRNVEVRIVEPDPEIRAFGGLAVLDGNALDQLGNGTGGGVEGFVENAIDP